MHPHARGVIGVLFVVLSPAIASGQQASASTPGPITLVLGSSTGQYVRLLTAAFDSLPASRYDFKPTPVQRSIGDVAQHLENANYQLCAKFGNLPYVMSSKDSLADSVKAKWPKDTLVTRLKNSFAFCQRAFATLTDSKLTDELSPIAGGTPGQTFPRARFVVLFLNDLVDHWSQIAGYMRLMGMVPPSAGVVHADAR
jgi:uncharacterized damage-inducible protein DinB